MELDTFLSTFDIKDSGVTSGSQALAINEIFPLLTNNEAVSYAFYAYFLDIFVDHMDVIDGMYTFIFRIENRFSDIILDINSNVSCKLFLNDIAFNSDTPVVVCNGKKSEKLIRFYIIFFSSISFFLIINLKINAIMCVSCFI